MPQQPTRLDLDGRETRDAIERAQRQSENAIEGEAIADAQGVERAEIAIKHEGERGSVAGVGQWDRVKGWAAGVRARWRI